MVFLSVSDRRVISITFTHDMFPSPEIEELENVQSHVWLHFRNPHGTQRDLDNAEDKQRQHDQRGISCEPRRGGDPSWITQRGEGAIRQHNEM